MKSLLFAVQVMTLAVSLSGCAKMMANLRRDFDDGEYASEPTVGGRWSEKGFLSESMPENGSGVEPDDRYAAVGHSERAPAGTEFRAAARGARSTSWMTEDRIESDRRDSVRTTGEGAPESPAPMVGETPRRFKSGARATRADFIDESPNEGSLWAPDGQTNYYFSKNKVRTVGDIVTITAEEDLVKDVAIEIRRSLTPKEKQVELAQAQEKIRTKYYAAAGVPMPSAEGSAAAASNASRAPASAGDKGKSAAQIDETLIPEATLQDVDLGPALEIKAKDPVMSEIVERYPNGNYKIRGTRKVNYKNGASRTVTVVAIARGQDIGEDDIVNSGKLYEYRIESIR